MTEIAVLAQADINEVNKTAHTIKSRLEALDNANKKAITQPVRATLPEPAASRNVTDAVRSRRKHRMTGGMLTPSVETARGSLHPNIASPAVLGARMFSPPADKSEIECSSATGKSRRC